MQLFSTGGSRRAQGPIGLDLGSDTLRLLQLSPEGHRPRVVAAAERSLGSVRPTDGSAYHRAVADALRAMLGPGRFRGRRVVSALPASVMHFKNLRLPRMPADELTQAVQWEARERGQFGDQAVEVRYFNVGEVRQGDELRQEVILMAAPTAFTEAHVETLVDCGLDPVALDVAPAALQRAIDPADGGAHPGGEAEAPARIVLDVGYSTSKVLIVQNEQVLFFKLIEVAGHKFDEIVAQRLDLSLAEAARTRRAHGMEMAKLATAAGAEGGGAATRAEGPAAAAGVGDDESGEGLAVLRAQGTTPEATAASEAAPQVASGEGAASAHSTQDIGRALYEAMRPAVAELAREVSLCLRYYSVTFRSERPQEMLLIGGEASQPALGALLAEGTGIAVTVHDPLASLDLGAWSSVVDAGPGRMAWATAAGMARRRNEVSNTQGRAA